MGLFRTESILCPAGRWTTLISNFGTGIPKAFALAFHSETGADVSGVFLEQKYFWIFPKSPVRGSLAPLMHFNREWINGIYKVMVKPDVDLIAEFK